MHATTFAERMPMGSRLARCVQALGLVAGLIGLAGAASAACLPMAHGAPRIIPAAYSAASVKAHHLRISYIGHSTFEVESPQGVRIATDYNDYIHPPRRPTIVTMNNAHDTHFSYQPDEAIPHVLRGWDPGGGVARHNLSIRDVRVRNVPTNFTDLGGKLTNNNSMFLIESQSLCVVHISHLHHVLSKDQLRDLGRIDIAFAPIDGMWTMSHRELFEVLDQIKPVLIIPMHYGSLGGVQAFIEQARARQWPVRRHGAVSIELSFRDLPRRTEVLFLDGS